MPSNLYGVANAPNLLSSATMGADVTPTAGVNTPILTSGPLIAPSQGFYYPVVWAILTIQWGTPLPSNVGFGFQIGSGSALQSQNINNSIMTASTVVQLPYIFAGAASSIPWQGAGSVLNFTAFFATNTATVSHFGSFANFWLMRAPDQ